MKGIKEVLALNLKINRLKQGLTQDKLAEKAGISTHYLAMVELARKFPSAGMIERLAAALDTEPHELFYMPGLAERALDNLYNTLISRFDDYLHSNVSAGEMSLYDQIPQADFHGLIVEKPKK